MSGSNPFRSRSGASGGCQERMPAFPLSKLVLGLEARCQVCNVQRSHVAPVVRSGEQRSARASTRPAATRAIRTYAHMVTRRFAPRDGLHFLVRAYGFTETLRRAAQREGVGMTACHGLGGYIPLSRGVHLP